MVVRRFNCFGCGLDGATSYAPNPKPHVFVPNSVFLEGSSGEVAQGSVFSDVLCWAAALHFSVARPP